MPSRSYSSPGGRIRLRLDLAAGRGAELGRGVCEDAVAGGSLRVAAAIMVAGGQPGWLPSRHASSSLCLHASTITSPLDWRGDHVN